jgi:hypothetical protein
VFLWVFWRTDARQAIKRLASLRLSGDFLHLQELIWTRLRGRELGFAEPFDFDNL